MSSHEQTSQPSTTPSETAPLLCKYVPRSKSPIYRVLSPAATDVNYEADTDSDGGSVFSDDRPVPEVAGWGRGWWNSSDGYNGRRGSSDSEESAMIGSLRKKKKGKTGYSLCGIVSRTVIAVVVTGAMCWALWGAIFGWGTTRGMKGRHVGMKDRARKILDETPLIDGHNDLAIFIRAFYQNKIHDEDFYRKFEYGTLPGHVDVPRLRSGQVGGAFWSAFVECQESNSTDFSDEIFAKPTAETFSQIDLLHRLQSQYSDLFSPPTLSSSDALKAWEKSDKFISPLSIEGLHQVPPSAAFSTMRNYYSLGVRAATLTHNCYNKFADPALITSPINGSTIPAPPLHHGVSHAGYEMLIEMNRLGIFVDISHTSYETQMAVLGNSPFPSPDGKALTPASRAPVIYTHSSAYALCPHPRNVRDTALYALKANGGVAMVNFSPDFISCTAAEHPWELPPFYPANSTLHQVARHIMYIGDLIGYEHVGLGSDFDGIPTTPEGLDGVDMYPSLVAELLRLGVEEEDVSKVVGGNLMRVWAEVERIAGLMRDEGVLEREDHVEKMW